MATGRRHTIYMYKYNTCNMHIDKSFNIIVAIVHNDVQMFENNIYKNDLENYGGLSLYTDKLYYLLFKKYQL